MSDAADDIIVEHLATKWQGASNQRAERLLADGPPATPHQRVALAMHVKPRRLRDRARICSLIVADRRGSGR